MARGGDDAGRFSQPPHLRQDRAADLSACTLGHFCASPAASLWQGCFPAKLFTRYALRLRCHKRLQANGLRAPCMEFYWPRCFFVTTAVANQACSIPPIDEM